MAGNYAGTLRNKPAASLRFSQAGAAETGGKAKVLRLSSRLDQQAPAQLQPGGAL
ncbi:MAG: hypothetical protein U5L02_08465 [Rheinheimera sp.]|nr:hypothetical protein [Rheinheimera sp.]